MAKVKNIIEKSSVQKSNILYHEVPKVLNIYIKKDKEQQEYAESIGFPTIIDLDKKGDILNIEILHHSSRWSIDNALKPPKDVKKGRVFIEQEEEDPIDKGEYYTNKNKKLLYIQIEKEKPSQSIEIAENVILDITPKNKLGGIWILNLPKNIEN